MASQYILEKTNSELDEESVSELANLMIEGKDIDEFVKKKFSKDEEQTEPDEFYFQTLETGTLNLPNGTYEGQFKNGKPHGKGKLTYNVCFISTYSFIFQSFLSFIFFKKT